MLYMVGKLLAVIHMGFTSCLVDPDVWMRPAVCPKGVSYYENVLLYVDDALVISHRAEHILRRELGKYFELKEESIGPSDIYLGGKMRQVTLENGVNARMFGSSQYVQAAVRNVETYLEKSGRSLPAKADTPLKSEYRTELDTSPELKPGEASYFQSLIGTATWIVELGRIDICCEVSMMSSHLALPRQGHLEQMFHMFAHLKKYHNSEMVFDPSIFEPDMSTFERKDWTTSEHGLDLKEELPPHMPQPRGIGFLIRVYVDADHASNSVT